MSVQPSSEMAYTYSYDCRIFALYESELEHRCSNYWQRRIFLNKFDDWREWNMPNGCLGKAILPPSDERARSEL